MKKVLLVFLAACGGGQGGGLGTGPISQAQAESECQAVCQKDIDCGVETDLASCVARCAQDFVGWARGDAVSTIFDCVLAAPCGTSDGECLGDVLPLAIHEQWEAGCRSELAACLDPQQIDFACEVSPSPLDEEIGIFRFIAPAIMEDIIACLDAPDCEARLTCVENVLETNNINF